MIKSLQLKSPVISFYTSNLNTTSEIHRQFIEKTGKGLQLRYPLEDKSYKKISQELLVYLKKALNSKDQYKKISLKDINLPCYNHKEYSELIESAILSNTNNF